jgi:two-component system alkaline phosphatase synthesis response regulator PhoP
MMSYERILVVDDEAQVRALCVHALTEEGYQVVVARNGYDALERAEETTPSLAIIDVMMPDMDGIELCRSFRSIPRFSSLPILFLTARGDITDKAAGYAVGADDYLTKPFDIRELVMRVRALLRRASPTWRQSDHHELKVGDLRLNRATFTLSTPEKSVALTPVETDLMHYLMTHPGLLHSPKKLLVQVWRNPEDVGSEDVVRQHIKNIRHKIEPDPAKPRYIRTVRPHGYTVSD